MNEIVLFNTEKIEKELEKVIPPRWRYFDLHDILSNDISMYLSIRADAGKTINALLLALVFNKLYKVTTIYIRNDDRQTVESVTSDLFDKIVDFGYVAKLYDNNYNATVYRRNEKAFYLIKEEDGEEVTRSSDPVLLVRSNESYKIYKSGGAPARAWFIIWDEFLDSTQPHSTILQKFFDNVSTFGRDDPHLHVMALSNTVNKYDAIFEDMTIADDIEYMDFGDFNSFTTELGSKYYVKLLPVSVERKSLISNKKIRFFGINKSKFANFTGVEAWKGYNYKHMTGDEEVKSNNLIAFIHHRNKWMAMYHVILGNNRLPILHITRSNEPRYFDRIVYTMEPTYIYEKMFTSAPELIRAAYQENRIYFSSNNIGLLFDDFLSENKIKRLRDRG